jgi:hypothetical protein
MKHFICLITMSVSFMYAIAQDEGTIVKRERLARSQGIFISAGPSFTLGKNIGDYSVGFNIEAGYTKRLNRVVSIGPSLSYLQFNYDADETGFNNIFIGGPYQDESGAPFYLGALIDFKGGNLSLTSLAVNFKVNIVPVMDNSKISVYGFAKPFVSYVNRSRVSGEAIILSNYYDLENPDDWYYELTIPWESDPELGIEVSDKLKAGSEVTGGIFVGPGIEISPAKSVSFYIQASFGYTFPITFVSSKSYSGESLDTLSGEFPMIKEGFPSVNVQAGLSFNF